MLEHLGLKVNRLIRLSFGPFQLGDLKAGEVTEVPPRVLRDQIGSLAGETKPENPRSQRPARSSDKKKLHARRRRNS